MIESLGNQIKGQEDVIKYNLKRSLIIEINELSKQFRKDQRDYLLRKSDNEQFCDNLQNLNK